MVGQLVTLPLRIWLRSVQLTLRVGEELTGRALEAASGLVEAMGATGESDRSEPARSRPPDPPPHRESAPERPHRAATRTGTPRPKQPPEITPAPPGGVTPGDTVAPESPVAPPAPNEPSHVSEELELVAESAEPGAEDGAGASVRVLEPWDGYRRLGAREVVARLAGSSAEELAAVELYELAHRNRPTVLEAVKRALRMSAGPGSPH